MLTYVAGWTFAHFNKRCFFQLLPVRFAKLVDAYLICRRFLGKQLGTGQTDFS
jgi:hypothetical protein